MPRTTEVVSVSLTPEMKKWLDDYSQLSGRSRTSVVTEGLKVLRTTTEFKLKHENWEIKLRRYYSSIRRGRPKKKDNDGPERSP